MAFGHGRNSICIEEILDKISEGDILAYYLGVKTVPCVIHSPLRRDRKPSFGLYSTDGKRIYYKDFSTKENGGLFDLLCRMWGCSLEDVLIKINNDICKFNKSEHTSIYISCNVEPLISYSKNSILQCKIREWKDYDIEYWKSYGVSLQWLKYAEVYPISHKIIVKNGNRYVFGADKYAYAYVEHKEGNVTLKIYQPFNKNGYKWSNKHDMSVISLWTKVPKYGNIICICSSLKDALCLWVNTGIPSLSVQGEGYNISNTAINELKRRYKKVFILFDNDKAGLEDGIKLSNKTGFINVVLPKFEGGKDISDLFHSLQDKKEFSNILIKLFKEKY